jgi:hypothetical protein
MTQNNTTRITGLTFVATLGGRLFGYDTAVIHPHSNNPLRTDGSCTGATH